MTSSRGNPIATISSTTPCRADPLTKDPSLGSPVAVAAVSVAGAVVLGAAGVSIAAEAKDALESVVVFGEAGAASVAEDGFGVGGAFSDTAAGVEVLDGAAAAGAALGWIGQPDQNSACWIGTPPPQAHKQPHLADHYDHEVLALLKIKALYRFIICKDFAWTPRKPR